jgi:two-component system response regulator AtoC/two-component system nitrogen regulation response regulator NtrX
MNRPESSNQKRETKTILIVDDDGTARYGMRRALEDRHRVLEAEKISAARTMVAQENPDLLLLDIEMPEESGLDFLRELKAQASSPAVIMITAYGSEKIAVEAMKSGAYDYLPKPFEVDELRLVVERALEHLALAEENLRLKRQLVSEGQFGAMIGSSKVMRELFDLADRVAQAEVTVLIQGESGTGKELLATEIHRRSNRGKGPFVALNCAALPEHLIESELFGYEKGAFTGATSMKRGKFELAHGGTLFLDEVGDMSLATQARLLRVLETRRVERLGGTTSLEVDVRIVSATNKDLAAEITRQTFREDLYYRLRVVLLRLPPLREHREDLPLLVEQFCRMLGEKHGRPAIVVSKEAMDLLMEVEWKGNVRELKNVLESAIVMSGSDTLRPEDFPPDFVPGGAKGQAVSGDAGFLAINDYREARRQFEIAFIRGKLREHDGNITRTAAAIGLHRQSLQEKLRELGIQTGRELWASFRDRRSYDPVDGFRVRRQSSTIGFILCPAKWNGWLDEHCFAPGVKCSPNLCGVRFKVKMLSCGLAE